MAVDSVADLMVAEAGLGEVGVVREAAEDSIVVAEDVSTIVSETDRLLVLAEADSLAAMDLVDSTIVAHAATLTWNLCLLEDQTTEEEMTEEETTEDLTDIRTEIVTALVVGMPDRSDLTTAVGMTSQGRDAATKWLYHWAPDGHHSTTTLSHTQRLAFVAA